MLARALALFLAFLTATGLCGPREVVVHAHEDGHEAHHHATPGGLRVARHVPSVGRCTDASHAPCCPLPGEHGEDDDPCEEHAHVVASPAEAIVRATAPVVPVPPAVLLPRPVAWSVEEERDRQTTEATGARGPPHRSTLERRLGGLGLLF